jgi:hypothetical protein
MTNQTTGASLMEFGISAVCKTAVAGEAGPSERVKGHLKQSAIDVSAEDFQLR